MRPSFRISRPTPLYGRTTKLVSCSTSSRFVLYENIDEKSMTSSAHKESRDGMHRPNNAYTCVKTIRENNLDNFQWKPAIS